LELTIVGTARRTVYVGNYGRHLANTIKNGDNAGSHYIPLLYSSVFIFVDRIFLYV